MGTRFLASIPHMVRNFAAEFLGRRGTPNSLTSVMTNRPSGSFDSPLPSRFRIIIVDGLGGEDGASVICGVGDGGEDGASAICGVGDGGEDGASAISLTCYLYNLHMHKYETIINSNIDNYE